MIVRHADTGEVLVVFSPYGMRAAAAGGLYTIPIPPSAVRGENLRLRFEIQESHDATPRPAREGEIVSAELFAVQPNG